MQQRFFFALLFMFTSTVAFAGWLEQQTATGEWCGLRPCLEDKGVTISSIYTTDVGGNPVGGVRKSTIYSGFLDVGVALDFEKIACLEGLSLTISNYWASGQNLSASIGNFFGVQEVYTPGSYFFGVLNLSQSLCDDTLTFEIGRLFAGDLFAQSEFWQYYLTSGLNGNFEAIETNILFPTYNIAAWAARVIYEPNKNWQFVAGIYNGNRKVEDPNRYGLDFSLSMHDGYLALGQVTFKHHQTRGNSCLPGSLSVGGYYQSSKFQNLANSTRYLRGNYGYYLILDQMLFRGDWLEFEGSSHLRIGASYAEKAKQSYHRQTVVAKDRPQGLSAWGGLYVAPEEDINTQIYQLTGGLVYQGMFASRPRDVSAFCIIAGKFSDKLPGQGTETVVELDHRFQLGRWLYFTPDVQYVIKPNGQSNIPNALVLGFEMSINF